MKRIDLKAIIFDYGHVLSLPPSAADKNEMAKLLQLPIEECETVYRQYRAAYDNGDITAYEYWSRTVGFAGASLIDNEINALIQIDLRMWTRPQKMTIDWVPYLRQLGFRTGLLSNMHSDLRQYLDEQCSWLPSFDHRTISGDIGCIKPNADIYYHCLDGLNVRPSEALFLDDLADNIKAAEDLGLNAILFTNAEEVADQIEARFAIRLPRQVEVGVMAQASQS